MNQTILCLFVKPPVAGQVKTRLARDLGAQRACQIYQQLVENILRQLPPSGLPLALFFADDNEQQLPPQWQKQAHICLPQQGEDLGERMAKAFEQLFTLGYQRVLLAGSDVVGLDAAYLKQAARQLQQRGMVITPAEDGGYCLIGFARESFTPHIFAQIAWSTPRVYAQTMQRCQQIGLASSQLSRLRDIDTLSDLRRAIDDQLLPNLLIDEEPDDKLF